MMMMSGLRLSEVISWDFSMAHFSPCRHRKRPIREIGSGSVLCELKLAIIPNVQLSSVEGHEVQSDFGCSQVSAKRQECAAAVCAKSDECGDRILTSFTQLTFLGTAARAKKGDFIENTCVTG